MSDSTADDRGKNAGVGDCFWGNSGEIAIEDHEVVARIEAQLAQVVPDRQPRLTGADDHNSGVGGPVGHPLHVTGRGLRRGRRCSAPGRTLTG